MGPIREATRDDVPGMLAIYNEAILNTTATADYHLASLESRLAWYDERVEAGYPVLVYDQDGIRGYATLGVWVPRTGYRFTAENAVYIASGFRGQGIGKAMLGALIEASRSRGFHRILARIAVENEASLRLHEKFGFVEVGRLSECFTKFDRWIDVVLMELRIQ